MSDSDNGSDNDSDFGATTAETRTIVGNVEPINKPCTGPLKSHKEGFNFKDFLKESVFGKAQKPKTDEKKLMGWGQYITDNENKLTEHTNPPFPDSSVLGKYNDDIQKMEECTKNRTKEEQKFHNEKKKKLQFLKMVTQNMNWNQLNTKIQNLMMNQLK